MAAHGGGSEGGLKNSNDDEDNQAGILQGRCWSPSAATHRSRGHSFTTPRRRRDTPLRRRKRKMTKRKRTKRKKRMRVKTKRLVCPKDINVKIQRRKGTRSCKEREKSTGEEISSVSPAGD